MGSCDVKTGLVTYPYPPKNITDLVPCVFLVVCCGNKRRMGVFFKQGNSRHDRHGPT